MIGLVIAAITLLGPLQLSLNPDLVLETSTRGLFMILTIVGTLAALSVGLASPQKA